MKVSADVAVLGCGWAGILLSYVLSSRNLAVVCIEKEEVPGGLLRSEVVNGFVVDIGGSHVVFSRDTGLLNTMLSLLENWVKHERKTYIFLNDQFVPYPFENGLYVLPPEERYEALVSLIESLLENWNEPVPGNLEKWVERSFGKWIASKYMIPYNRKLWKRPLSEIDIDWLGIPGRLPVPDWRKIARSAVGIPTTGYEEQARFYYPVKEGIQSLYRAVYEKTLKSGAVLITGNRVTSVKKRGRYFVINDQFEVREVYSTIPLPDLLRSLDDTVTRELSFSPERLADRFDYNKLVTVAVALNKLAPNHHWVYVPDEKVVFHRYAWISNYSPFNAPPGKSLILAEITVPMNEEISGDIASRVLEDLQDLGIFRDDEVLFYRTWVFEHGYPVHKIGLSKNRELVVEELNRLGVKLVGRWGAWRYLNMDMVLKDVLSVTGSSIQTSL